MKRIFAWTLVLAALLTLTACGQKAPETTTEATAAPTTEAAPETTAPKADLTVQEIADTLKAQLGDSYVCGKPSDQNIVFGQNALDAAQVLEFYGEENPVSSVGMDQVILLKVADGYAETAAAGLQKGFDQKIGYARMYNMDLFRLAETRLFVSGNYVAVLTLGKPSDPDADAEAQAAAAAEDAAKVDAVWESLFGAAPENRLVIPEESQEGQGGIMPGARPRG